MLVSTRGTEVKGDGRGNVLEGQGHVQTAVGVTCATFPTSSSACIIRLILATGNFVFTSIPSSTPGAGFAQYSSSAFAFLVFRPTAPAPPFEAKVDSGM